MWQEYFKTKSENMCCCLCTFHCLLQFGVSQQGVCAGWVFKSCSLIGCAVVCCGVLCCPQVELVVSDIKESVSRVSDVHFIAEDNMTVPSIAYEVGVVLGGC